MSQRRQWHPTPVLLPGKSRGRRSLVGCCLWGRTESDWSDLAAAAAAAGMSGSYLSLEVISCDIVIYRKKQVFAFHYFSGRDLKSLEFPKWWQKMSFVMLMVTCRPPKDEGWLPGKPIMWLEGWNFESHLLIYKDGRGAEGISLTNAQWFNKWW